MIAETIRKNVMLKIRKEQFDELNRVAEKRLHEDLFKHVSVEFPQSLAGKDEAQIKQMIEIDINRARKYGVHNREGIFKFVDNEFRMRENEKSKQPLLKYSIG